MQLQPEMRTVLSRAVPTTGCITEIWSSESSGGSCGRIKCVSEINVLSASISFREIYKCKTMYAKVRKKYEDHLFSVIRYD